MKSSLIPSGRQVGTDVQTRRLNIEAKLLLSANRKSYMPRRLAQQQMTLSDLECLKSTSSASRAICAVSELLVVTLQLMFVSLYRSVS